MKAFILAAGQGKRMRPLTEKTPKPLVTVNGTPLIEHLIIKLAKINIRELVINCSWLAEQLMERIGDGDRFDVQIEWSYEDRLLDTAGAINQASHLLGDQPFLLHNSDVWCDLSYQQLLQPLSDEQQARLILVPNPSHNQRGDFNLNQSGLITKNSNNDSGYTYSGISVIRPEMITKYPNKRDCFPLREVFFHVIEQQGLYGQAHHGHWSDVGTLERLQQLENYLAK